MEYKQYNETLWGLSISCFRKCCVLKMRIKESKYPFFAVAKAKGKHSRKT